MGKKLSELSKENGYFLVATFVIIAVLLVFGAVILRITLSEYRQAEFDKNKIKAYYLARSGAELTADSIMKESLNAINTNDKTIIYKYFSLKKTNDEEISSIFLTPGTNTNLQNYWIESTASVKDITEVVELEIKESTLFDKPLFTNDNINLTSNNSFVYDNEIILEDGTKYIYNSVDDKYYNESDSTDYYEYSESGEYYSNINDNTLIYKPNVGVESKLDIIDPDEDVPEEYKITYSERDMPPLTEVISWNVWDIDMGEWPENNSSLPSSGDLSGSGNIISENSYYEDISINDDLTIDTTSGQTHLVVDDISVKGKVEITGGNTVIIYVNPGGTATFQTPNDPPDNLLVFLGSGATFTAQANSEFNGFIYGPDATVILNSADTTVNGSIFVDQVNINKNPDQDTFQGTIEYEPFPSDFFGGSNPLPVDYVKGKWR